MHDAPASRSVTPPRNAPTCHSPSRLQATDTGGGHTDMHRRANRPQVPDTIARCNGPNCPNDNTTPVKTGGFTFAVIPRTRLGSQQKRPFGRTSRPSLQAVERSMLQSCNANRVRLTVRVSPPSSVNWLTYSISLHVINKLCVCIKHSECEKNR
jgi:hypothetical protein